MILSTHVKANGKVDLWDLQAEGGPAKVELWATDAAHALETDPGRYSLDPPGASEPAEATEPPLADEGEGDFEP